MNGADMPGLTRINRALALGFEEFERALEHAAQLQSDGYPPYNIERSSDPETDQEVLTIVLAVAGFDIDELEVREQNRQLIISGKAKKKGQDDYLYQGIAKRQFQRSFILADQIEVTSASLKDGLLTIMLRQPEPKLTSRKIDISSK